MQVIIIISEDEEDQIDEQVELQSLEFQFDMNHMDMYKRFILLLLILEMLILEDE